MVMYKPHMWTTLLQSPALHAPLSIAEYSTGASEHCWGDLGNFWYSKTPEAAYSEPLAIQPLG